MRFNVGLDAFNVVFTSRKLEHMSEVALNMTLGELETTKLIFAGGNLQPDMHTPDHLVDSATWDEWVDEDEEDIRFVGLSRMFPVGKHIRNCKAPGGALRAPEMIFTDTFDYHADLWCAGCLVRCFTCSFPLWTSNCC